MNNFRSVLFTAIFLLTTLPAYSEGGVVLGFITGNKYMDMNENDKVVFIVGAMDGIMVKSLEYDKEKKEPWLGTSVKGITIAQIQAVFEKELKENPEWWHAVAAMIFRSKMIKYCKEIS